MSYGEHAEFPCYGKNAFGKDKIKWEQWAADVAKIAQGYMERINRLIAKPGEHKVAFDGLLEDLRKNINPAVSSGEVVEMLAQHLITKPVFEVLFENYSFVKNNPVSRALQSMIELLKEQALEKDAEVLTRFYESVKMRVSGIDNAEGRQRVLIELYDKFFRTAFPLTVEKLGIVYTPVEIVDFINRSVADVLQASFGRSLSDENVHILDPFTGTGTFIVRMIQNGLIAPDALKRKYKRELHANEIILLAYYIASVNIENAWHAVQGEQTEYTPFDGICLTDTFQLSENDSDLWLHAPRLKRNSERMQEQQKSPIQVIIANPPYSVGQKSANDNAQNQHYEKLEKRIADTYVKNSVAIQSKSVYDSYIKAFRWASDRLPKDQGGIIAFVSNGGWLNANAMDGFRKCLEEEFSEIYVFNLRGAIRGKHGELAKKEGKNVFNIMTGVAITVLVKKPRNHGKTYIRYHDIGDYLSREEKLKIIAKKRSVLSPDMGWEQIHPNAHGDWLNQRNEQFSTFIPLGDKDNKDNKQTFFVPYYSPGVVTARDAWCYNFSKNTLIANVKHTIMFYNKLVKLNKNGQPRPNITSKDITMTAAFHQDLRRQRKKIFDENSLYTSIYRPFNMINFYFHASLNERPGKMSFLFPTNDTENLVICVSGTGNKKSFSSYIANSIPDFQFQFNCQCFPLYYYEKKNLYQQTLLDEKDGTQYVRKDGVTDFILERCRINYGPKVTKEDIFYYVYGLLHSPDYRKTFAADLKKMLPRLPLVEKPADFWAFSKAGRDLAKLHLNYETQPACPQVHVEGEENGKFQVEKMRFPNKDDKTVIDYNGYIRISNIPLEAYEYVVNGRSAIEWVMERYQIKTDKASGIINDPNDWAKEHDQPRYILDLLLSVITVSLKTMEIVKKLPSLSW